MQSAINPWILCKMQLELDYCQRTFPAAWLPLTSRLPQSGAAARKWAAQSEPDRRDRSGASPIAICKLFQSN